MFNIKKQIQTNHVERKEFSYAKNNVSLRFTLRTDIKKEAVDFLECLENAIEDVKKIISK